MSLLDFEFRREYDLMLSAWGEGELKESDLLDFQQPDSILKKYQDEYRTIPKTISLCLMDPMEAGYHYGFTGIDTPLLEKLKTLKELILPPTVTRLHLTPRIFDDSYCT